MPSYNFTKGRYRARIVTGYYDQSDSYQEVEGDYVEFNADPVEYFEFVTNSNIKVNLSTMEAPEGITLIEEGDDHGIHYKRYENSLAILTGTQTSDFSEEGWPKWCEDSYIYASINIKSGWVFKTSDSVELQIHNSSFVNGATSAHLFNHGYSAGWQYIDIEGLDTSNLRDFSYMFSGCTVNRIHGLNDLDFSNGTNFDHFTSGFSFRPTGNVIWEFDPKTIDPTGTNHKFDYAFDFGAELSYSSGPKITIRINSIANTTMFRHEEGVSFYYTGHTLYVIMTDYDGTPNMPVDCSHLFDGNKFCWLDLQYFVAPVNCNLSYAFANCNSARYINLQTATDFSKATNMTGMCKNDTLLLETPRYLNMDNCLYADEMYSGCYNLGYNTSSYSSRWVSAGGSKLISAKKMFYGALQNWGGRAQLMSVYVTVSDRDDVDCSEIFTGYAGMGYSGGLELYLGAGSNNHLYSRTISLKKAFYQNGVRNINIYCNRGSSGDNYLAHVDLEDFIKEGYVKYGVHLENLRIANAKEAFYGVHDIENIGFFDFDYTPSSVTIKSACKFDNNADVTDMLYGCTTLQGVDVPDNMSDKGSNVSINLPVSMRPYNYSSETYGEFANVATQSLAGYTTYSGD